MNAIRHVGAAAAVSLFLIGCATNPATGKRQLMLMSEAEEIALGKQYDAQVREQMGVYDDPALQRYVNDVGQRLAKASHRPNLPWTFTVVDEPAVNAFALPGGYIYLTRGILPFLRSEAEMAAVLGHEVGHVDARHSASAASREMAAGGGLAILGIFVPEAQPFTGLASAAFGVLFLQNSREAELESDKLGVGYAVANGWAPAGMTGMLQTLQRLDEASGTRRGVPNWAMTHPPAADRLTKLQDVVASAKGSGAGMINANALEQHLDGLVFGDSREKGIVRGSDFFHPVLGFALRFPAGWEVINTNEQVTAIENQDANVGVILQLAQASGSVEQTARTRMSAAGFRELNGGRETINGLPAYVGTYQRTSNSATTVVRAAHIQASNRTYLLAGLASPNDFNRVDQAFDATILSFRPLRGAEAEAIQPNRVDFYVVRGGDSWQSIAGRSDGAVKPSTLAIMNGSDPSSTPRAGERIRVVVGG
jgi:predicted Zn-dependent protease